MLEATTFTPEQLALQCGLRELVLANLPRLVELKKLLDDLEADIEEARAREEAERQNQPTVREAT